MAVSRPSDQDILDAIQEESRPTDDDILKAIGEVSGAPPVPRETQQAPAGYQPGIITPESIQRQQEVLPPAEGFFPRAAQTIKRAGAGFAEGIAHTAQDIPGTLARVMSPQNAMVAQQLDLGHPYKRVDLVKRMERAGILTEARAVERIGQRVGEIGAFLAPVGAAERGLIALGAPARIANLMALGGATAMQASSDARAAGIPMTGIEAGKVAGITALGLVGGTAASKGIEAGVSKLLGSEVGKSLGVYLGHAALGAIFENLSGGLTPQERKEHALAGALAFTLGANHSAMYQGVMKARSERQWHESLNVMADETIATRPDLETAPKAKLGIAKEYPKPRKGEVVLPEQMAGRMRRAEKAGRVPTQPYLPAEEAVQTKLLPSEMAVRVQQARQMYQNATIGPRMPYEAGIGPDMLTPEAISRNFEIPLDQAKAIVARGTDPREAREIVQDKRQEAVLTEAEKRDQAYQRGLTLGRPGLEATASEQRQRIASLVDETKYRLGLMDKVESKQYEAKRETFTPEQQAFVSKIPTEKEALAAMEADVAAMEEQLKAQPSPQERAYILQRQAEEGNLNRLQGQPELKPPPFESRPPTAVLRTPKKAAGQQEQQFRIERRGAQQARQAGQGPPVVAAPLPPPVAPRPAIKPPRPAPVRVQEVEGLGRVSVMAPEERIRKAVADAPHQSYGKLFEPDPARLAQLDAERAAHIADLSGLVDKITDQRVKSAAQRGLFDMQENLKARDAEKPQLSPEEKRRKPKPPCKG